MSESATNVSDILLTAVILIAIAFVFYKLRSLLMASNAELQTALEEINAALTEAGTEIPAKLQELRDLIAASGPGTTPEIDAMIADLKTKALGLKDVVSDTSPQP